MSKNEHASKSTSKSGFSLVEVAVALSVAGFALIALLGLLATNYRSSSSAKEETVTAAMIQDVLADLKTQKFSTLQGKSSPGETTGAYTYYFDADGNELTSTTGAFFTCTVGLAPLAPATIPNPPPAWTASPPLLTVTMTFTWPMGAATPNKTIINASLAQF